MECAGLGIWLTVDPVQCSSIFRRDVADNYFIHGFSFSPLKPFKHQGIHRVNQAKKCENYFTDANDNDYYCHAFSGGRPTA
jgi:hypothetical protein